jgi:hypothetical protein
VDEKYTAINQRSVNVRIDGENPEAVEAMRLLLADAFQYLLTKRGRTDVSTGDKYKGNGLARITALQEDGYVKAVLESYKKDRARMKRIYVEADNLKPLIDWLKTKPSNQCKVLIGVRKMQFQSE